MDLLEQFRARFPFALDAFQVDAIRAIQDGQSVLVSAPTGAGKTLVAEFAIQLALARGRRIAYTTPLKALSNQKFGDFTRSYGANIVGILTGDVKVNPRARVLVMTTEILRNMFYAGGLEGLGYVVLDECHYMGDEGRGTVWEEIIVNAPHHVVLVALSATVANVAEIADWISLVHRPIEPIFHPERPVPLSYAIADLAGEIHALDKVRTGRARVVGDESRGPDERGRWYTRRVVDPTVLIEALETRGWLPAIYFIFSRAGCERAMQDVLTEGRGLLTREQQRAVDEAIAEAVAESPSMGDSELNQTIFRALGLGVAVHHAGVLPSLKRLIERLFERRRCIDAEGQCIVALDARDGLEDVLRVIDGAPEPIESRFKLGYGSAALLLDTGAPPEVLRRRIESSFGQYQNLKRIRSAEADVGRLERALGEARAFEAPCGDFERIGRYRRARQEVEARRRTMGRGARRGERHVIEAEPGRVALVRRRGGPSLAVILGVHS